MVHKGPNRDPPQDQPKWLQSVAGKCEHGAHSF
jgi:hypothetical protein